MLMPETSRVRNTYMAEFSLNLPWLNRRRHNSEIDEAQAKLDTAQAQYELQRSIVCESDKERRCGVRGARVDWALSATCRRQAMLPPIARFYAARERTVMLPPAVSDNESIIHAEACRKVYYVLIDV